jgi:hypothetical protein
VFTAPDLSTSQSTKEMKSSGISPSKSPETVFSSGFHGTVGTVAHALKLVPTYKLSGKVENA